MKKSFVPVFSTTALVMALAVVPRPAFGQTLPVQVGLSGGAAFPTGEFGRGDGIDTGWGFEVRAVLDVAPGIGVYVAYDRYTFQFERASFFGLTQSSGEFVDHGWAGGIVLSVPTGGAELYPWIRGGAIYNSLEPDFDGLDDDPSSGRSLGYELGAGLGFPLGSFASVSPSLRYRTYEADLEGGIDFDVGYLVGEIGLTFRF